MNRISAEPCRAYILVSGRVQGVFFRESTRVEANIAGVLGMVRNIPDGRVEAIFEGTKEAVTRMVDWCRTGPPQARVEDIQVIWEEFRGDFRDFRVMA